MLTPTLTLTLALSLPHLSNPNPNPKVDARNAPDAPFDGQASGRLPPLRHLHQGVSRSVRTAQNELHAGGGLRQEDPNLVGLRVV